MNAPRIRYRDARPGDVPAIELLIHPFVKERKLLPRSSDELRRLTHRGFVAEFELELVGFAAVEIYSPKLAEVQCLAVRGSYHGKGVGRELLQRCVACARHENVLELMAISSSEDFMRSCGFDYSLPDQKKAFFIHTRDI
jgi:amino-acid N-acetyltransferase